MPDPAAAAAGGQIVWLESVGSTNAEALRRARGGASGPLWIAARTQTAGRGRRGRPWVSEPGNLYASLLLTPAAPSARLPELSFVAALALHDALVTLAPPLGPRLRLKWPNDVLADGAKLAGILIEGESAGANASNIVIGFGVNCAHHPTETAYAATDLGALGCVVAPDLLLQALAAAMARRLSQWRGADGFGEVRTDWLARAHGLGQPVRVRTGTEVFDGTFTALDAGGRLILSGPDGASRAFGAGEVFPALAGEHAGEAT